MQKKIPEEAQARQQDLDILAALVDGQKYAECIHADHPDLWQAPRRIRKRKGGRRYFVPKRILTLLRIYRCIEHLLTTSKGAPAYAFASRIAELTSTDTERPLTRRTVERYLSLVLQLVSRNYCVRKIEGKGYLVSCPSWEARKAEQGDLFDPPKLERVARSYWLNRDAREMVARLRETPAKNDHIEGVAVQDSGNAPTNGPLARSKGRSRRAGPAPPAMQRLARTILTKRPPPHCPRIDGFEHLAHCGAVHLLRRGYHRDDIGRVVGRALRETDTAAADGLPDHVGRYFWGVLKALAKDARRWKPTELLASRREFWKGELDLKQEAANQFPDCREMFMSKAWECEGKLARIDRQQAAIDASYFR